MTNEAGFTIRGSDGSSTIYDIGIRTDLDRALAVEEFIIPEVARSRRQQLTEAAAASVCQIAQPDYPAQPTHPMLPGMHETTGQLFDPGQVG